MHELDVMYRRVAEKFADRICHTWASEGSLKAEFEKNYKAIPFTRTDYWPPIIHKIFRDVWLEHGPEVKAEPQGHDKMVSMRIIHSDKLLDYNIFTQVLLNMQNYLGLGYAVQDAERDIEVMKLAWKDVSKLDPFAATAKMIKNAATVEEKAYNNVISTLKAHKIIGAFGSATSFRVSPMGSTPAFADSKNISMIGVGGDQYLRTLPSLAAYYLTWESTPTMAEVIPDPLGLRQKEGLVFAAPGIPYPFVSRSGGEILQEVLFARKIMWEVFGGIDITQQTCIQIPRINSVLVVTTKYSTDIKVVSERLQKQFPGVLTLTEGVRG